jgi:hypothetical protein
MATVIQILTTNYSGETAQITFTPCSGGTINLGNQVLPYNYESENYQGSYSLYFSAFTKTCTFDIPCPTSTPTPTPNSTSTPTPTPTVDCQCPSGYTASNDGSICYRITTSSPTSNVGLTAKRPTGTGWIIDALNGSNTRVGGFYVTGGNNGQLYLANSSGTENVVLDSAGTSYFNGGRVGIGTASPSTIFQVCGDITGENVAWIQNTNSSGYGALRALNNSNYATVFGIGGSGVGYPYANTGYLYTDSGVNFTFSIGGSEKMKITSAGNVGICVGSLTVAGGINAGTLYTTTQRLTNTAGNYANMIHKVQGASGGFSQVVVCVSLNGAGGWGYIINGGSTSLGSFQSGGGYTNGTINYSHGVAVGSGYTVSSPSDNVIRFVGPGGVHPFTSIQMFGSLAQDFGDAHICIYYS